MKTKLRLKRHESFVIREGWIEKAISAFDSDNKKLLFGKAEGVKTLGIGANMVKSLRFWLIASGIINDKNELTSFGKAIRKYDRYLERDFTLWMIQANLATNYEDLPVFNIIFNSYKTKKFETEYLVSLVENYMKENDLDMSNFNLVKDDVFAFERTYLNSKGENPEDNSACVLSRLQLLKKEGKFFSFENPSAKTINYLNVYYCLLKCLEENELEDINIDSLIELNNSPSKIFNLDRNLVYSFINEMGRNNLITVNRTAGLNMIYLKNKMNVEDIFNEFFKGE